MIQAARDIISGRTFTSDQRLDCDVVIVGSGASGAVVAQCLTEVGLNVIVVEEGPNVTSEQHARMRPTESMRHTWRQGAFSAALGVGDSPVINVTMGRCIGGSSTLTGGVCFRTPGHVLDRWAGERQLKGLSEKELEPYFDDVERVSHVQTVPTDLRSRSTTLWDTGCQKAFGATLKPTRRNMRDCDGCAKCNFGCPQQHKMSVDRTYLPAALRSGATILSDCLVTRVVTSGGRATGVEGRFVTTSSGQRGARFHVSAKWVVLAAGAAHTPLLLMRSGIAKASGQCGRNMTLHPSIRMTALFNERVEGWKGAMQSAYTDHFEHDGVTLISVFVPPAAIVTGMPGMGPELMDRVAKFPHTAMFGGLIHDEAGGRIWRIPGTDPLMTYRVTPDTRPRFAIALRRLAEAYIAAGATHLYLPVLGHAAVSVDEFRRLDIEKIPLRRWEVSSQHPMGTCRMGTDRQHSVTDSWGHVWDCERLTVVDGSTVPTSLGVNPQLTIMALALRFGRHLADEIPRRQA